MKIWNRIRSSFRSLKSRIEDPAEWLLSLLGYRKTSSGEDVTERTAAGVAGVYACVRVRSEDLASLPLKFYEAMENGTRREARDFHLWRLFEEPNDEQHGGEFVEMLTWHLNFRGNGYARIVWSEGGEPLQLWPLHPDWVKPRRVRLPGDPEWSRGKIIYFVTLPEGHTSSFGNWIPLAADDVFHVRGISSDGIVGMCPLDLHFEAIGLGIALEKHGAAFFGRGGDAGGVLEAPNGLSETAWNRLQEWIKKRAKGGLDNAHVWPLLEEGVKYARIGLQNDHAQYLESRKYQNEDYARIYRVPLHKIQHLEHATFSNIEHQGIEYVTDSIRPDAVRWERAIRRRLMSEAERERYYARFTIDALMRGDMKTRYDAHAVGRQWGWRSADDVLDIEDENPLPNGLGKIYLVPANMINAANLVRPEPRPLPTSPPPAHPVVDDEEPPDPEGATRAAFVQVFEGELERLVRKEANAIVRAVKKVLEPQGLKNYEAWTAEFYESHQADVRSAFARQARALGVALGVHLLPHRAEEYAANAARVYTSRAFEEIGATIRATPLDAAAAAQALATRWMATRAAELAPAEVGRAAAYVKSQAAAAA